jgi:GTP-binding protein
VEVITGELKSFGAHLEDKPMLLVASKMDIANKEKLTKLRRYAKKHGLELYPISAATGEGVEQLKLAMSRRLEELRQHESEALAERK